MNKPIQIRLLSEVEGARLTANSKFNILRPSRCTGCGSTEDFGRRMFRVRGVPKAKRSSDDIRGLITHYLMENHAAGYVFFKTHQNTFYVDSAVCRNCGSTLVLFDIELTDDLMSKAARMAGKPLEQFRAEFEAFAARMEAHDLKPEQPLNVHKPSR